MTFGPLFFVLLGCLTLENTGEAGLGVACVSSHAGNAPVGSAHGGPGQRADCRNCHESRGSTDEREALTQVSSQFVHGGTTVSCAFCHDLHGRQTPTDTHPGGLTVPNLMYVRANTGLSVAGALEPALFQRRPDHFAFAEGNPPYNGICQSCHTRTVHHTNNGAGDHTHKIGSDCTTCHPHRLGFKVDCFACHNSAPPAGEELAPDVTEAFGWRGSYPTGHVGSHGITSPEDCLVCHDLTSHRDGVLEMHLQNDPNGDGIPWSSYRWTSTGYPDREDWCLECHNDNNGGLSHAPGSLLTGWISRLRSRRLSEGPDGTMSKKDYSEGLDTPVTDPLPNSEHPTFLHARYRGCLTCHGAYPHDTRFRTRNQGGHRGCGCHDLGRKRTDSNGNGTGTYLEPAEYQTSGGGEYYVASNHEVAPDEGSDCRRCHDPHRVSHQRNAPRGWSVFDPLGADPSGRSSVPFLGTETDFCARCHTDYSPLHSTGLDCASCHTPHGSILPSLLWFDPAAANTSVTVTPSAATVAVGETITLTANVTSYPSSYPPLVEWRLVPQTSGDPGVQYTKNEVPGALPLGPMIPSQTSSLSISDARPIAALRLYVDVPWGGSPWIPFGMRGDLQVKLAHNGKTALVQHRWMEDWGQDLAFWYDGVNGVGPPVGWQYYYPPGPRRPWGDLGVWNGEALTGTWTLSVEDVVHAGSSGYLGSWTLRANEGSVGILRPAQGTWQATFTGTVPGTATLTAVVYGGKMGNTLVEFPVTAPFAVSEPVQITVSAP